MIDSLFSRLDTRASFAPGLELNRLALDGFAKLAEFQLERSRSYTELTLEQMRTALTVDSPEQLQAYLASRPAFVREMGEKLQQDVSQLAAMGTAFADEFQRLTSKHLARVNPQAAVATGT